MSHAGRAAIVLTLGLLGAACTAVSSSRPLSGQPPQPLPSGEVILTGPPRAPYRTVGFCQVQTRGATLPDIDGVSDTELDPVLRSHLAQAVRDAGADAAILIDFADVRPPRPATRPWSVERNSPPGRVRTRDRLLEVSAELIVFERPKGAS